MTACVPDLPPIPSRFGFAFSGDGRWATCLRGSQDEITLERWDLARSAPSRRTVAAGPIDRRTCAIPLDDGRVVVMRPPDGPSGRGEILLAEPPESPDASTTTRATCATPPMLTGYLLAAPSPDQTTLLITLDDTRHSRIWRLSGRRPHLEPVLRVPGTLSGGVWLDGGRLLALDHTALDHTAGGHRANGIVVDLRERSWRRAWSVSATSDDRIAAYSPRTDHLAVTSGSPGAERIGLRLSGAGPVRFPTVLNRSPHPRTPLTFDAGGHRLLIHEVHGAASRLLVYLPAEDRVEPIPGPAGTLWPPASWTGEPIHIRFSAPHQPPTLATVPGAAIPAATTAAAGAAASTSIASTGGVAGHRWSTSPHPVDDRAAWKGADLVELPGPAGTIEAIVYGGPDWRRSRHLVMALHGGPLSSWRFEFDPLLQHLAAAGIAVLAPNYRGSTGYGMEHLRPVIGDWAGPDLDDVVHLARAITATRDGGQPRPILLGASYGAYLALLAAGADPGLWSRCVALAPFTSAPSLHQSADAAVRDRVARLSGLGHDDRTGPRRDVLDGCGRITAPLLLVHGTRDQIIPVGQSRALRRRLLELGRTEGPDFAYVEVDDDHVAVVQAWPDVLRETVVRFCLGRERHRFHTGQEGR
ncbi:alpha/beta hydrolase family protein [Actinomadura xylanilytica]|uniref:alpha/beta hydrolase family protein n=1 Tax=Actinomadura xylanilytica TaxID=887459 RepID=UPI00255B2255|nr:alpha/beta fold hydrolase [Actinomadura xylanilytica]MDL4772501.1 alpha/beta fold hydrolase [Actinomadura xylanilytica]